MKHKLLLSVVENLRKKGVSFDRGLDSKEINQLENIFQFIFPPDLKEFLEYNLPVSEGFVHWRYALNSKDGEKIIHSWMNMPIEGILFDIKNSNFWMNHWGKKPSDLKEAIHVVKENFKSYPKLIPIYRHRFISCEPNLSDNPILSVHQSDIIYYGFDLASYFANEFHFNLSDRVPLTQPIRKIIFWSDIVS